MPDQLVDDVQDSPEDLILAVAGRQDRAAYVRLFRRFADRVEAYALRLGADAGTAQDIVQDTMLTVWRRAETFNPTSGTAQGWIFTIARNRFIDRVRQETRPEPDRDDPLFRGADIPGPECRAMAAQEAAELETAIGRLPPAQVELLRLYYFAQRTHVEIASSSGLPLGTVKTRLRLAIRRLKRDLR